MPYEIWITISEEVKHRNGLFSPTKNWPFLPDSEWPFSPDPNTGGITNPLTVIEQLTYLMFIRSLDEKELETEEYENMMGGAGSLEKIFPQTPSGQAMRWSKCRNPDLQ